MAKRILNDDVLFNLTSQGLAITAWSFATLGLYNEHLMTDLAERALQADVLSSFKAQEIAILAWALAKLNVHKRWLMDTLADRALYRDVFLAFTPKEIAKVIWAYATLHIRDTRLMSSIPCCIQGGEAGREWRGGLEEGRSAGRIGFGFGSRLGRLDGVPDDRLVSSEEADRWTERQCVDLDESSSALSGSGICKPLTTD